MRKHDLLLSGMAPLPTEELVRRTAAPSLEIFTDRAFRPHEALQQNLGDLLRVAPQEVVIQTAATGAYFTACQITLDPVATVAVEDPHYEPLWRAPESLNAAPLPLLRDAASGRLLDPSQLPAADVYVVSHPYNPSGHPLHPDDLDLLLQTVRNRKGYLILAGAYLPFLENDGLTRPLPKEIILTGSLTKAFGLSPLRLGFLTSSDPYIIEQARNAYDLTTLYLPTAAMEFANELAFDGQLLQRARDHAAALQPLWKSFVASLPRGFRMDPPPCGIHAFFQLPYQSDDLEFCVHAAKAEGVHVTPGRFFHSPGWIRIGCGRPVIEIDAALEALSRACHSWVRLNRPQKK